MNIAIKIHEGKNTLYMSGNIDFDLVKKQIIELIRDKNIKNIEIEKCSISHINGKIFGKIDTISFNECYELKTIENFHVKDFYLDNHYAYEEDKYPNITIKNCKCYKLYVEDYNVSLKNVSSNSIELNIYESEKIDNIKTNSFIIRNENGNEDGYEVENIDIKKLDIHKPMTIKICSDEFPNIDFKNFLKKIFENPINSDSFVILSEDDDGDDIKYNIHNYLSHGEENIFKIPDNEKNTWKIIKFDEEEKLRYTECPICTIEFDTGEEIITHGQNNENLNMHGFHNDCIYNWYYKLKNEKCPIDRKRFFGKSRTRKSRTRKSVKSRKSRNSRKSRTRKSRKSRKSRKLQN
jgi:hypothetical protein